VGCRCDEDYRDQAGGRFSDFAGSPSIYTGSAVIPERTGARGRREDFARTVGGKDYGRSH
jgi:hypothetical protein